MSSTAREIIVVIFIYCLATASGISLGMGIERHSTVSYLRSGPVCSETTKRAADAIERGDAWD